MKALRTIAIELQVIAEAIVNQMYVRRKNALGPCYGRCLRHWVHHLRHLDVGHAACRPVSGTIARTTAGEEYCRKLVPLLLDQGTIDKSKATP
jgi:hypothetical protein